MNWEDVTSLLRAEREGIQKTELSLEGNTSEGPMEHPGRDTSQFHGNRNLVLKREMWEDKDLGDTAFKSHGRGAWVAQ